MNVGAWGEIRDPVDHQKQEDPHHRGTSEAQATRQSLLFFRQAPTENRQEDDVVDPQNDFQRRQGDEGDQVG